MLHAVSFGIGRGSVFGVIGPSGAGKTTVMRCLPDIIRPSSGHITVLGENPRTAGPGLRRRIGYLPGELFLAGSSWRAGSPGANCASTMKPSAVR